MSERIVPGPKQLCSTLRILGTALWSDLEVRSHWSSVGGGCVDYLDMTPYSQQINVFRSSLLPPSSDCTWIYIFVSPKFFDKFRTENLTGIYFLFVPLRYVSHLSRSWWCTVWYSLTDHKAPRYDFVFSVLLLLPVSVVSTLYLCL